MSQTPQKPLVSVIIPTHDRASLVLRAIESVLGQTYTELEVIVVDDGSTDNTAEVVGRLTDGRVRYYQNQGNRGQSYSRNRGAKLASGEFIAFLDSDDYWLPGKLAAQMKIFDSYPHMGMVYSNVLLRDEESGRQKVKLQPRHFRSGYLFREVIVWDVVCHLPTWVMKRDLFLSLGGFDETLQVKVDREFMVRFARHHELHGLSEPLVVVSCRDSGRISNADADRSQEAYSAIMTTIREATEGRDWGAKAVRFVDAHYESYLGKLRLAEGDLARARSHFRRSVASDPRKLKTYLYLFASANSSIYGFMRAAKRALTS